MRTLSMACQQTCCSLEIIAHIPRRICSRRETDQTECLYSSMLLVETFSCPRFLPCRLWTNKCKGKIFGKKYFTMSDEYFDIGLSKCLDKVSLV